MLSSLIREFSDSRSVSTISTSTSGLLSQIRVYIALYRLYSVEGAWQSVGKSTCCTLSEKELFEAVLDKLGRQDCSLYDRALLTEALYTLSRETGNFYQPLRAGRCEEAVLALMKIFEVSSSNLHPDNSLTAICRVLESFFYPEVWEDDEWFVLLQNTLDGWCASLSADMFWRGLPMAEVWHRLEVFNRYSYLFRDKRYDTVVSQTFRLYAGLFSQSIHSASVYAAYLDAVLPGHLFYSVIPMYRLIEQFASLAGGCPEGSDNRMFCLSYAIVGTCDILMKEKLVCL